MATTTPDPVVMNHAFDLVEQMWVARHAAGHLLLGLDFDGTLVPIVPRPEDATLDDNVRDVLRTLSRRADTSLAFISGRSLFDITLRVGVEGAFYVGNHGLEIAGPGVHRVDEQAEAQRDLMGDLAHRLERALAPIDGAQVEDKGLTLSVHYRRVRDGERVRELRTVVNAVCAPFPDLRCAHGKMVVEVRPNVDWDKGSALDFLRGAIAPDAFAPTVFIGDDQTDEDGFREVGNTGYGVIVADPPPDDTTANAFVASTDEVALLLRRLAA